MALLDIAAEIAASKRPGPDCDVTRLLAAHPEEADDIIALVSSRHSAATVAETFAKAFGSEMNHHTIGRHRRNQCANCKANGRVW